MHDENNVLGLATVRHNRGVSLEQIAEPRRSAFVRFAAIDRGDFRVLPGGIYNTSYIRQYARAIDYAEDDILAGTTAR